jgi:hypothetical protein
LAPYVAIDGFSWAGVELVEPLAICAWLPLGVPEHASLLPARVIATRYGVATRGMPRP